LHPLFSCYGYPIGNISCCYRTPDNDHFSITPTPAGTDSIILQQTGTPPALVQEGVTGTCQLEPINQPPWPDKTFTPNELDSETGLHITGRPQQIDLATYRLQVTGLVDHPLSLTYDELRCMPKITGNPDLNCPGVFIDRATWTGVPIKYILELAGVQQGASKLTLVSADGYQVKLPLETASLDDNFLAYEVNGAPLPVQHGFPLRAVFPSMWGSYWLKWLIEIRIS
jgi:DMSO/TMAO reductase YedYZ molybdopterin-dependent catalytic subunit